MGFRICALRDIVKDAIIAQSSGSSSLDRASLDCVESHFQSDFPQTRTNSRLKSTGQPALYGASNDDLMRFCEDLCGRQGEQNAHSTQKSNDSPSCRMYNLATRCVFIVSAFFRSLVFLVGAERFELSTPSPPDWCANQKLRHAP